MAPYLFFEDTTNISLSVRVPLTILLSVNIFVVFYSS